MGISEFLEVGTEILKSSCNQVQENLREGGGELFKIMFILDFQNAFDS